MNKLKLLGGKSSLVSLLSLVFLVLGIGCISWAMLNIWEQSHYSADITPSNYLSPKTSGKKQTKLAGKISAKAKSDDSLAPVTKKAVYAVYPGEGDNIGSLTIPALKRKVPIIQGTGDKELKRGVGHFTQSVLPGEEDNCVLSGHRDTVFTQIGNLKIGDQLIVQTSAGIFTYEVNGTRIVHKDDKTVIVPTEHAILTMTTCYPFNFIGDAPDRYIVSAALIKSK